MFGKDWLDVSSDLAKSITNTLEKTGEALTKGASAHVAKQKQQQQSTEEEDDGAAAKIAADDADEAIIQDSKQQQQDQPSADSPQQPQKELFSQKLQAGWGSVMEATKHAIDVTRDVVEKEQERLFANNQGRRPIITRDLSLPLDVEALRDAEVVYITNRLITMGHPAMQSSVNGNITPDRKLAAVGHLLQKRHPSRYMVWNLSEVEYDVDVLEDQVLTFQFPGSPCPPLGLLLKLLISMESWLKADDRNVAVVHCLTGRGRTSTVLAAFLCWTGEAGFTQKNGGVNAALSYIAKCKQISTLELTIPSQRRYAQYFTNMLDGVRPSQPPLILKRIIMSEAPKFAKGPPRTSSNDDDDDKDATTTTSTDTAAAAELQMGCAPYLQIFKAGQLLFTTAASLRYNQPKEELPFCCVSDGPIAFHVENVLQGDVLVRCRHLTNKGQRISMFRAAFHTGYVPPNVMRLTKAQLDGACYDERFSDDFFLDLIFEPCDAEMASKHLLLRQEEQTATTTSPTASATATVKPTDDVSSTSQNEAEERRKGGTLAGDQARVRPTKSDTGGGGATVTASAYDSMLHRDSRFWDVIAARRQEHATHKSDKDGGGDDNKDETDDPLWGPTIGRRRVFGDKEGAAPKSTGDKGAANKEDEQKDDKASTAKRPASYDAFSIGGEFDFLPDPKVEEEPEQQDATMQQQHPASPPKRDELMEALMAVDDEDDAMLSPISPKETTTTDLNTEEIVFSIMEGETAAAAGIKEQSTEELKPTIVALPPPLESSKDGGGGGGVIDASTAAPEEESSTAREEEKAVETVAAAAPTTTTTSETKEESEAITAKKEESAVDIATSLLDDVDDLDVDVDAFLLASAAQTDGVGEQVAEDLDDLLDLDDDAELEDLENFLTQVGK